MPKGIKPRPLTPEPKVVRVMREYREALIAKEDDQLQRMANRWIKMELQMQNDMLLLARELEDAKLKGSVITEQLLWDQKRFKALNAQMQAEINKYITGYATPDIEATQKLFGELGITGAGDAIRATYDQYTSIIKPSFHLLPKEAIEAYVGLAGDGSPLKDLLMNAYPDAFDGVTDALISGMARGIGPVQIAKEMADGMGMGLDRITLIARTEQLRVWRTASVEQYRASGVVHNFKRMAARQSNTCAACLALDGQLIPVGQELTDHPRGRCTTVPCVDGVPAPTWQTGEEWFNAQAPEVQKSIVGDKGWELWHDGKVPFKGFASFEENEVWGASPRTTSLTKLAKMAEGKVSPIVINTTPPPTPPAPVALPKPISPTNTIHFTSKFSDTRLEEWGRATRHAVNSREAESIRRYTGSGAGEVNRYLRGGGHLGSGTQKLIDDMTSAFNKMPVLEEEMTVFRGTSFHTQANFDAFIAKTKVGGIYEDLGFMSTSITQSTAQNFGSSSTAVLFEIKLPPGTTGIQPFNSLYPNEREVILNKGSKFTILGATIEKRGSGGQVLHIIMQLMQ